MIAVSEGTESLGDQGYNVLVGGTLFHGYEDHPNVKVWINKIGRYSTAAGRYQILHRYWFSYKVSLKLPDFSPESQDAIAIQLIKECRALDDIQAGRLETAIEKCRSRWASLPGAGYGQHENSIDKLKTAYLRAGGNITHA